LLEGLLARLVPEGWKALAKSKRARVSQEGLEGLRACLWACLRASNRARAGKPKLGLRTQAQARLEGQEGKPKRGNKSKPKRGLEHTKQSQGQSGLLLLQELFLLQGHKGTSSSSSKPKRTRARAQARLGSACSKKSSCSGNKGTRATKQKGKQEGKP